MQIESYFPPDSAIDYYFAPGRVCLIGEHIDYNGGLVLSTVIPQGIRAAVRRTDEPVARFRSIGREGDFQIPYDQPIRFEAERGWANYPAGVVAALLADGFALTGVDVVFESNLPEGAGLSSSAALAVQTATLLLTPILGEKLDKKWLAVRCQQVENQFIGVNCGIMDQFTIANTTKDSAVLLNCETLDYELIPANYGEYTLVIMDTNKKRELAESKYNERVQECAEALRLIRAMFGQEIPNLCAATLEQAEAAITAPKLLQRAKHAITENQRVTLAAAALREGRIKDLGRLFNESHRSLRDDYAVTGSSLNNMAREAMITDGCAGARMTGAGFGGCAIALVETTKLGSFIAEVSERYLMNSGRKGAFYY